MTICASGIIEPELLKSLVMLLHVQVAQLAARSPPALFAIVQREPGLAN
jgi:hypothetical protein